jgi:hypothetical protein
MDTTRMLQIDNDDYVTTLSIGGDSRHPVSLKQIGGRADIDTRTDVVLLTREEWDALAAYATENAEGAPDCTGDHALRTGIASAQVDGWIDYTPCAAQHRFQADSPCVLAADHTELDHCNRYGTRW